MTKFGFLFIALFIGVTIVLLLVPRKGLFKPVDKRGKNAEVPAKQRLSYIQKVLLISGIISFAVLLLVKLIMER
ncbi:MAG: hypothetical protein ABIN89_11340 [Chitinophagaceae bacterium]